MKSFFSLFCCIFIFSLTAAPCRFGTELKQVKGSIVLKNPNGKIAARILTVPGNILSEMPCAIKDGWLEIDNRKIIPTENRTKKCVFRFYGPVVSEALLSTPEQGKKRWNGFRIRISGPVGSSGVLRFEGVRAAGNKHFITHTDFITSKTEDILTVKEIFPHDLKNFWMVLILQSPGQYRISAPEFFTQETKEEILDPAVNYLPNGGAEHGFAGTMFIPPEARAFSHNNTIVDWRGIAEKPFTVDLACDEKVFYSGKRSFRFRINSESLPSVRGGIFLFQPVPYRVGKPICFSIWLKADCKTEATLELTFGNGVGVTKKVSVDTEWKKQELFIPEWGKNNGDFRTQGQILNTFHAVAGHLIPKIVIQHNVTVWLDDAAVTLGGKGEFRETSPLFIRLAKLDHNDHLYIPGETINAMLQLEGASEVPEEFKISYKIYDFFGNIVKISGFRLLRLQKGKCNKQAFAISLPKKLRGPLNLIFTAEGKKNRKLEHVFYLGVIEKTGKLNKRFCVEVPNRQNVKKIIPYIQRFGFGMIRCGGASGQSGETKYIIPYFKEAGIDTLVNYSITSDMRKNPKMPLEEHLKTFEKFIQENGRNITILETENESNLFMDAAFSRKVLLAESRIVRKHYSHIKIAGPAACRTDFSWLENALQEGGDKALDYVSEHPYRKLAEEPDYGEDCIAVRKLINCYNPQLKHIATEAGSVQLPILPGNRFDSYNSYTQANDLRLALLGLANGLESYNFFAISTAVSGVTWSLLFMGNKDNDGMFMPTPLCFAVRHAADSLGDAKAAGKIPLGGSLRGVLFDKGDSRLAVLWKYKGDPATFSLNDVHVTDAFGTMLDAKKISVGQWPVYIKSKLSSDKLIAAIQKSLPWDSTEPMLEMKGKLIGEKTVEITLKNITPKVLKNLCLKFDSEQLKNINIAVGETKKFLFRSDKTKGNAVVSGEEIKTQSLTINQTALLVPAAGNGFSKPFILGKNERTCLVFAEKDYLEQCSGIVSASWDQQYLYFRIRVNSPEFHPKKDTDKIDKMYQFDSIQFGFDTLANGKKSDNVLQDDDFE